MPSSKASCDGGWCATVPRCLFTHAHWARLQGGHWVLGYSDWGSLYPPTLSLHSESCVGRVYYPMALYHQDLTLKPLVVPLHIIVCPPNMGGHCFLNEETLERAPILLFNRLVRCPAHECSFARLSCLLLWMPSYLHLPFSCIVSYPVHQILASYAS